MKKYQSVLIPIVIVLLVIFAVFALSKTQEGKYYKTINEKEYKEITKKDAVVYVGNNEDIVSTLEKIGKDNGIKIYAFEKDDPDVVEIWKEGKKASSFDISKLLVSGDAKEKKKVTMDEYVAKTKAEGYNFMYVGRTGCGYCEKYDASIKDLLAKYDIGVYYLDIADLNEEEYEKLNATDTYFASEQWGTPTTMLYKDGVRINMLSGYVDSTSLIEFVTSSFLTQYFVEEGIIK